MSISAPSLYSEYVPGIASQKDKERLYHDRLNGHMWGGQKTDTFTEHKVHYTNVHGRGRARVGGCKVVSKTFQICMLYTL